MPYLHCLVFFCPIEPLESNADTYIWQTDSIIPKWIHLSVSAGLAHKHYFTSIQTDFNSLPVFALTLALSKKAYSLHFPSALLTTW